MPVILDLMGPRYRLGEIAGGPRLLRAGRARAPRRSRRRASTCRSTTRDSCATCERGERVLIDNGLVELRVEAKRRGVGPEARVLHGGPVGDPQGHQPARHRPAVRDLAQGPRRHRLRGRARASTTWPRATSAAAASSRRCARWRGAAGRELPIIAKLERARAIEHLDEIVEAADAVMVARGDLGVEVPLDQVPVLQKRIVAGRPPARQAGDRGHPDARVDDRAAAADPRRGLRRRQRGLRRRRRPDALGRDGGRQVTRSRRCAPWTASSARPRSYRWSPAGREGFARAAPGEPARARARSAAAPGPDRGGQPDARRPLRDSRHRLRRRGRGGAAGLGGAPIVAFSQGGFTARMIARYRPTAPILVFTNDRTVARRMQLVWGVRPVFAGTSIRRLEQVVRYVDAAPARSAPGAAGRSDRHPDGRSDPRRGR